MKNNPNRFWITVILLGWVFDFLFWKKPLGINFAIFVTLCLATGILILRADGLRFSPRSGLLLLPIAFLAAMTFIRLEPMTIFLSILAALFLMGIFTITYLSGEWIRYSLLDYVFGYLRLFGSMIVASAGFRRRGSASPFRTASPESEAERPSLAGRTRSSHRIASHCHFCPLCSHRPISSLQSGLEISLTCSKLTICPSIFSD